MSRSQRVAEAPFATPTILIACLLTLCFLTDVRVAAQSVPGAAANQLHAAIANGDVESLKYWLTVRHADPAAANSQEPDVTPLERCLDLAARVLGTPSNQQAATSTAPLVGLRALQDMVALLDAHGAKLTDADRQHYAGPVLRWYGDAVLRPEPSAPSPAAPVAAAAPPSAPAPPATPPIPPPAPPPAETPVTAPAPAAAPSGVITLETARVALTRDERTQCNGTGHPVYLVNRTAVSIRAQVTTYIDRQGQSVPTKKTASYTAGPDDPWQLGCDVSADGSHIRFELNSWR